MSGVLPTIEELAGCRTDAERAIWLLTSPLGVLDREQDVIRIILGRSGFQPGVAYLECEIAALWAVRNRGGSAAETISEWLDFQRRLLLVIAGIQNLRVSEVAG